MKSRTRIKEWFVTHEIMYLHNPLNLEVHVFKISVFPHLDFWAEHVQLNQVT